MTAHPSLDLLQQMRHVGAAVSSADAEVARRARVAARISELQQQFDVGQQHRTRQRTRAAVTGAVACAAAVASWLVFGFEGTRDVAVVDDYAQIADGQLESSAVDGLAPERVSERVAFDPGREIVSQTPTQLRLPSHSTLELAQGSRFRIGRTQLSADAWRETIMLGAGAVELDVPRSSPERQLVVETQDASIEVEGARLSVSVAAGDRGETRVHVIRGEAIVRSVTSAVLLQAGQSWHAPIVHAPQPSTPTTQAPPAASPPSERASPPSVNAAPTAPRPSQSNLGEANRLMQAALLAKSGGMHELALRRFVELIEHHPRSEVAASARAERFRLLVKLGRRNEAQRAAEQYLKVHPHGFASAEAHALLD